MVSAQEPGNVVFYVTNPEGVKSKLFGNNVAALGPSGSADGAIASTPEKWLFLALDKRTIRPQSLITIEVTLNAADGIDWSDCALVLPYVNASGASDNFQNADFTGTDLVAATTAGTPHQLAYMLVKQAIRIGGNKVFFSLEDDTA